MLYVWLFLALFALPLAADEALEEAAWKVIKESSEHPSLLLRFVGNSVGALAQDPYGVDLVYEGLHDPNRMIRGQAARLAGQLRDERLKRGVEKRLSLESAPEVRQELIRAATAMGIAWQGKIRSPEEVLAQLHDHYDTEQITQLSLSPWRMHRILACRLSVEYLQECPIRTDPDPTVQAHALIARHLLGQSIPEVPVNSELLEVIYPFVTGGAATADTPLACTVSPNLDSKSLHNRLTSALHLLREHKEIARSLEMIKEGLRSTNRFKLRRLNPWAERFISVDAAREPGDDERARLHLIYQLLLFEDQQALPMLEPYLTRWSWEESVMALSLFLQEGQPERVKQLLNVSDLRVQIRAALVLIDQEFIEPDWLIALYPAADRFHKYAILEVLGKTHHPTALAFLQERMENERFASLRLIAAGAVLECLN